MQIDFHTHVANKLEHTYRLIRKAYNAGQTMLIYHPDERLLAQLDQALWTWVPGDFLPHVLAHDPLAMKTPIVLCHQIDTRFSVRPLLINFSDQIPANFEIFARLIEIVGQNEAEKQTGRERYKYYQQAGHTLSHTVISS